MDLGGFGGYSIERRKTLKGKVIHSDKGSGILKGLLLLSPILFGLFLLSLFFM
jgi:hypothetical protein